MTENENVVEETGVDEEIVIAETNDENVTANSPYQPIKDMAEKCGVEMPDMVATGDLTVENNKENVALVDDKPVKSVKKEVNKKDIPLPAMGAKFMFNGHEYKVVYINAGQHRFSCEPCKGVY